MFVTDIKCVYANVYTSVKSQELLGARGWVSPWGPKYRGWSPSEARTTQSVPMSVGVIFSTFLQSTYSAYYVMFQIRVRVVFLPF